jgi:hypothetical protein
VTSRCEMNAFCDAPRAWVVRTKHNPDLVLRACPACHQAYEADGLLIEAERIEREPDESTDGDDGVSLVARNATRWRDLANEMMRERDEARANLDAITRERDDWRAAVSIVGEQNARIGLERDAALAEVEQLRRDLSGALAMLEVAKERVR